MLGKLSCTGMRAFGSNLALFLLIVRSEADIVVQADPGPGHTSHRFAKG